MKNKIENKTVARWRNYGKAYTTIQKFGVTMVFKVKSDIKDTYVAEKSKCFIQGLLNDHDN